jgi:hypothetical protein
MSIIVDPVTAAFIMSGDLWLLADCTFEDGFQVGVNEVIADPSLPNVKSGYQIRDGWVYANDWKLFGDLLEHHANGMPGAPDQIQVVTEGVVGTVTISEVLPVFGLGKCPGDWAVPHVDVLVGLGPRKYPGSVEPEFGDAVHEQVNFSCIADAIFVAVLTDPKRTA